MVNFTTIYAKLFPQSTAQNHYLNGVSPWSLCMWFSYLSAIKGRDGCNSVRGNKSFNRKASTPFK